MESRFARLRIEDYALPERLVEEILSPALVVYLDRVRDNLARIVSLAGGDARRWRPHVKTTKMPEIFVELLRHGVRHFKCATTREARLLVAAIEGEGVRGAEVLVAYPLIGPALRELDRLARSSPGVGLAVLCEDSRALPALPREVSVFVDVDPGMNRTGVPLDDRERIVELARGAGDRFRGLHFYDGHVHGPDSGARRAMACAGYDRLVDLVGHLGTNGICCAEVVTSGTPSFVHALAHAGLGRLEGTAHRVSPGTVVFHDLRSERELEELDLVPAALVLSRVVSHPADDLATCDAGSKSIAAEAGDPCAWVLGHPELEPLRPSEEHLPLRVHRAPRPERGTPLLLVPRHVCPTVNLAEQALLIEDGRLRQVVPVRARAHDLRPGGEDAD